jgi:hypothetical protein
LGEPRFGNPASGPFGPALRQRIVQQYATQFYRKPTEKELAAVAPRADLVVKWASFLKLPNTGIIKLLPEAGCGENVTVISASENCLQFTMPGGGSSYSFRADRYRVRHLADLTNIDGILRTTGLLMHGILVDIGDQQIDDLNLNSDGLRFLVEFKPVFDLNEARRVDARLLNGVESDGRKYGRSVRAAENTTYAMRTVAYRGKIVRSVHGAAYNELDFDRRRDIIVVFRVEEVSRDGAVTLVWRQLADVESPKLISPETSGGRKDEKWDQ